MLNTICEEQVVKRQIEGTEGFEQMEFNLGNTHEIQVIKLKGRMQRIKFTVPEMDIDEEFTKGFGPGGQKTNKSNNCVIVTHRPTGLQVKSHDNRLQSINRKIARKNLIDRLDYHLNGATSKYQLKVDRIQRGKERQDKRRKRNEKNMVEMEHSDDEEDILANEIMTGVANFNENKNVYDDLKEKVTEEDLPQQVVSDDTDLEQYDMSRIGSTRKTKKKKGKK